MPTIGIPYARNEFHPVTGEPVEVCPVCGKLCPFRADEYGEKTLATYAHHYESQHEAKDAR